jgi:YD repeat-containing protein
MDKMNSNGSATLSYTGTGSTALGLLGSMTGSGHVGSQSYQYDQKNWLSSFTDASKTPSPSFGYTYSSAKELTYLDYPGNVQMRQIWNGKNITSQVYQNTLTQTTYASIYQSYTSDKLTGYTYNIKAGMTNFSDTVTPSYVSSGAMKEKLDTLTYSGSGRVITYGYDANHGRLNSLKYSDIDPNNPFALNYDSAGRLTSIVDPNSQTISTYSYNANNQGLLSSITYTGNKSASFTWNAKKQITNYVYTDNSTQPATTKAWEMTYYDDGRVATHTYSINDIYQYDWKYYYSPYGIDKALKYNSGQLLITIDATTAPNGRMLSLYYQDHTCQTNCFQGEASAAYDPCGNMISLVANSTGEEVWARAVDKNSDSTIGIYNPFNMEIPFSAQATINPSYDQPINGPIEFQIPEQGQWELKELLANLTKVNTTIGENGVDATIGGDDDCEDGICASRDGIIGCLLELCDKLQEDFDIGFERGMVSADYTGEIKWGSTIGDKKLADMTCEELERGMEWAKEDFYQGQRSEDECIEGEEPVDFGDLNSPLEVANKIYNYIYVKPKNNVADSEEIHNRALNHAIYSACEYWQMRQEYEKRCGDE